MLQLPSSRLSGWCKRRSRTAVRRGSLVGNLLIRGSNGAYRAKISGMRNRPDARKLGIATQTNLRRTVVQAVRGA